MSTEKRTHARARVKVVLEIQVSDNWGDECTIGQVHKQAMDSAEGMIRQWVDKSNLHSRVRIIEMTPVATISGEAQE